MQNRSQEAKVWVIKGLKEGKDEEKGGEGKNRWIWKKGATSAVPIKVLPHTITPSSLSPTLSIPSSFLLLSLSLVFFFLYHFLYFPLSAIHALSLSHLIRSPIE
jgi:hypothetical protein